MADLRLQILMEAVDRISAPFKRATQSTDQLKAAARGAAAEVRKLEQASASIEAFGRLKRAAQANATALAAAQQRAQQLGRELADGGGSRKAQAAFAAARREVNRLEAAQVDLARETATMRQRLAEAGVNTRDLAAGQRRLRQDLEAARAAAARQSAALDQARARMEALTAARRKLSAAEISAGRLAGHGAAAMAAGGGLVATGMPMIKAGADFETQLTKYGLTSGLGGAQLDAVRERIRALVTETGQSMPKLIEGLSIMVGKGMDPTAALTALATVGKAVTATGGQMDDMANLMFSTWSNLKVAPKEFGKAFDMMAKSGDEGGFELDNMARYFPQLTAAAAGLTGTKAIATLSASLQVALKGAADPSETANNFANFLKAATSEESINNFQKQGIDLRKALIDGVTAGGNPLDVLLNLTGKSVGVDFKKEAAAAMEEAGGDAAKAAAALTARFNLSQLFHDAQVQNYLTPMLANMKEFERIRDVTMNSDGTVNAKFTAMMATLNQSQTNLANAWGKTTEALGHALLPVLTPLVQGLTRITERIGAFAEANPRLTSTMMIVVGVFAALALAGGGLAVALASILGPFAMLRFVLTTIGLRTGGVARALGLLGTGFRLLRGVAVWAVSGLMSGFSLIARVISTMLVSGVGTAIGLARGAIVGLVTVIRVAGLFLLTNPIGIGITLRICFQERTALLRRFEAREASDQHRGAGDVDESDEAFLGPLEDGVPPTVAAEPGKGPLAPPSDLLTAFPVPAALATTVMPSFSANSAKEAPR